MLKIRMQGTLKDIQNVCRRIWKLQEKEQEIVVKTMETLIDGLERR